MTTDDMHIPTDEFIDHLEREVVSAYRHASGLERDRAAARGTQTRWLRAAGIALVSLAIGTTAGLASAQMRDGARRDSLLDAAKADAAMAALRLELARQQVADIKKRVSVGAIGQQSLVTAESDLRGVEALVMRARYNIEEITASSQSPRDDLGAPLVGGRDFVKDRIQLELLAAQQRLSTLESAESEADRRVRAGAATEMLRLETQGDVNNARNALATLAERLNLRKEFVERGTPVEALMRRLEEAHLREDASVAQQGLTISRARLALLERQRAAGLVGDVDVLRGQLEVKERELELQGLAQRLRAQRSTPPDSTR